MDTLQLPLAELPDPLPADLTPLDAFALWLSSEDGRIFYRAFHQIAYRARQAGHTELPCWQTCYRAGVASGVKWDHNIVPFVTRYWMIANAAQEFFPVRELKAVSVVEVEAVCRRLLADGVTQAGRQAMEDGG